jgi:threonine aldolase
MRQSGILAAAALYALDHHVARLAVDHANAALFIELLGETPYFVFDKTSPTTNVILFKLQGLPVDTATFTGRALERGVRLRALADGRMRATTHLGVTRDEMLTAVRILNDLAREFAANAA